HRLVDAARGFGEPDELVVVVLGAHDPHRRDVDAGDFELGCVARAVVSGLRVGAGEVIRQDGRLLPQRCDQPVNLPAVLGTLTHHVDVAVVDAAHLVVDTIARSTVSPDTTPRPMLGRIPAVTTTMSVSIVV